MGVCLHLKFENDVKKYGIQAILVLKIMSLLFENDVKKYGIQAYFREMLKKHKFENDVKMYGIQAISTTLFLLSGFENDVKNIVNKARTFIIDKWESGKGLYNQRNEYRQSALRISGRILNKRFWKN